MAWTALHRELGVLGGQVAYEMVQRAVDEGVAESADLDWKEGPPLPESIGSNEGGRDRIRQELSKDVAAMANSGGGLVIYGVRATGGRASSIESLGLFTEAQERRVRQVVGSLVHPPVVGLQLDTLTNPDDPNQSVLVLTIPDSVDAPHLVFQASKNDAHRFFAPWRDGPETRFMDERHLARAYRQREAARQAVLVGLDDTYQRFSESLETHESAWIVAVACPRRPLPMQNKMSKSDAEDLLWASSLSAASAFGGSHRGLSVFDAAGSDVRRGFQSWFRASRPTGSAPWDRSFAGRIELHFDGTIAIGFTRGSAYGEPKGVLASALNLASPDLERVGVDLLALVLQAHRALGISGDYVAKVGVTFSTPTFRHPHPGLDKFREATVDNRIEGFRHLTGPILTSLPLVDAATAWVELYSELVHQALVSPSKALLGVPAALAAALEAGE